MNPKFLKILLINALAGIFLTSCGTPALISTPITNIDAIPLKTTNLTDAQLKNWSSADLITDTIPGMSVNKAYKEIIKGKKGKKVIVAVIDSGTDIEHEDLKNVIWTNTDEVKNNGKDDDNNGYVDDIHGWNFLGKSENENLEFTRIIKKYQSKFKGKKLQDIASEDKETYQLYIQAKAKYEEDYMEAVETKSQYEQILQYTKLAHKAVSEELGKEDYTLAELNSIKATSPEMQQNVGFLTQMFGFADPGDTIPDFIKGVNEGIEHFTDQLNYNLNLEFDGRSEVGDNADDIKDTIYGDPKVMGHDPKKKNIKHGTHVAGIIAAERNNGVGIDGVANNVEIMAIRAVPNGDEYDKDIALAIRYAVDNGANIINTSFGKYFSQHPEWVREAIKYAAEKDVLIVNAAGNESVDIDVEAVYPNDQIDTITEIANNFITVGALNYEYGSGLVANFSNYGKSNVDVFAPGVKIWATTPNNSYEYLQGTSMAAPAVSGVAAVIRSYYPTLSAAKVKDIIVSSGLSTKTTISVANGTVAPMSFSDLSKSGKMVNLYNALILASQTSK